MKLVLFVLLCMWCYSYFKFRRTIRYKEQVNSYIEQLYAQDQSDIILLQLASSYTECQKYKSALICYNKLDISKIDGRLFGGDTQLRSHIEMNIKFCQKPLPWTKEPKDHNRSWLHNFLLFRLGGQRIRLISNNVILEANSAIRSGAFRA